MWGLGRPVFQYTSTSETKKQGIAQEPGILYRTSVPVLCRTNVNTLKRMYLMHGRKSQAISHRTVKPGTPLSETWSTALAMPAQLAPGEFQVSKNLTLIQCLLGTE